ncbi:hypothetical protein K523DRAFT_376184 [Schizophyllum commune Tattone D]|nr:hypothetical protein K523DRAFT_376184 [Schizophyllum commune Tattone D]
MPDSVGPSTARSPLSSVTRGSDQELTEGTPRGNQSTADQAGVDASDERDAQIQALRAADSILQAQVAALEAAANAARDKENRPTTNNRPIELQKPNGEAGGGKKGFNLQRAMGLEEEDEIYKRIQTDVRFNIWKYGLDPWKKYTRQSPEKISHVLQAGRQQHKYLCTERFPDDWAQTEMIKTIVRNRRKYLRRKARAAGKDVSDSSDSGEDDLPDLDAPEDGQ